MCGIVGYSLAEHDPNARARMCRALISIEERGGDATGFASWDTTQERIWYQKHNVKSYDFVMSELDYIYGRTAIGHTRMATTGTPERSHNNHPILAGRITGIHNGMLWDHHGTARELDLDLKYEVDSEVLFRAIEKAPDLDGAAKALDGIEGDASIAWLDDNEPDTLFLAALGGRPMVVGSNRLGFFFGSTEKAVLAAAGGAVRKIEHVEDGTLLIVKDGVVTSRVPEWSHLESGWGRRRGVNAAIANGSIGSIGSLGLEVRTNGWKRCYRNPNNIESTERLARGIALFCDLYDIGPADATPEDFMNYAGRLDLLTPEGCLPFELLSSKTGDYTSYWIVDPEEETAYMFPANTIYNSFDLACSTAEWVLLQEAV